MVNITIRDTGVICALGAGKQQVASRLFQGESPGVVSEDGWLPEKSVYVAKVLQELPALSDPFRVYDCRNNRLLKFAADEIKSSIDSIKSHYKAERIGVVIGSSTSGIFEGEQALVEKNKTGTFNDEFHYRKQEIGSPALFLQRYLALTGIAYTVSTACSSSGKVFAAAQRLINADLCDAVIVGGADSLCRLTINGFSALESVSDAVCDPMGQRRDGITIGEGAALFVLEKSNENNKDDIQLMGVGESSDAHHISAPDPEGGGAEAAMRKAIENAGLTLSDIDYINLHGTATPKNDAMESLAVQRVFGNSIPCSSTKALTGHCLGAAGAIEACFLWLTLSSYNESNRFPPHVFSGNRDLDLPDILLTDNPSAERFDDSTHKVLMSNSFAFGGSNVSVVIGRQ